MPFDARPVILQSLRNGSVGVDTPLTGVPGIGPYLEGRLRRAFAPAQAMQRELTVGDVWKATRGRTTDSLLRILHRALQNARGNQCVGDNHLRAARSYHVGDVNEVGYEAMVALLHYARTAKPHGRSARYGILPRSPKRKRGSRRCGCMDQNACRADRSCHLLADGTCVPRAHNAAGFVGVDPLPGQVADATGLAARTRAARRSASSSAARADRHSHADRVAGYALSPRYVRRGSRAWRVSGRRVRMPIVKR